MLLELEQQARLGQASIVKVDSGRVQLEFPDERAWAMVALAYPYFPAIGDRVLAIGQDGSWYVIGVLKGSGKTTLTVPGDLSIQAPFGAMEFTAAHGVKIKSPVVQIVATKLDVVAQAIFERFTHATRWVKETFQIRSGRFRTRVDGTYDVKADRIVERAEGDVKIDGQQIKLG
jgi:hypothetical protein